MMFSDCLQSSVSKNKLLKIFYASFISTFLVFSYINSASAHEGSTCEGEGPFGLPGLDLPPDQIGEWGAVIDFPVQATHSVVLSTGKVLFWRNAFPPYLFDPATDTFAATQSPAFAATNVDFFCAGHATMADGRVMVIGGTEDNTDAFGISDVGIFDPVTETWELVAPMNESRWYPTLTTLLDGRMLANEGLVLPGPNNFTDFPEVYDPELDTWTSLTSAGRIGSANRSYPWIFSLSDGNALMAGAAHATTLDVAFSDPTWTFVTGSLFSNLNAVPTAAMYRPDKIMKFGSVDPDTLAIDRAAILDMTAVNPAWREVSPINYERLRAEAVLLPNGKVMVSGGARATQNDHECAVHAAEIWDPDTEAFTVVASHALSRIYHSTSVLLPDGRILAAGGEGADGLGGLNTAEVYSPPYLFKGPRPTISDMPSVANYGTTFQLITPEAGTIESVSALRPASVTHSFDQNQRYLPLDFVAGSGQLTVTAPDAKNTPPGDYMIFLVNASGAVSVAKFIRLEPTDTDSDGVFNHEDNCTVIPNGPLIADSGGNSQLDTDGDGYGNLCDGDLNNDLAVNVLDLGLFKARFFTTDADADINGDGIVNVLDLGLFKALFFLPPGPSGPLP